MQWVILYTDQLASLKNWKKSPLCLQIFHLSPMTSAAGQSLYWPVGGDYRIEKNPFLFADFPPVANDQCSGSFSLLTSWWGLKNWKNLPLCRFSTYCQWPVQHVILYTDQLVGIKELKFLPLCLQIYHLLPMTSAVGLVVLIWIALLIWRPVMEENVAL